MQEQRSQLLSDPKRRLVQGAEETGREVTAPSSPQPKDSTPVIGQVVHQATGIGSPGAKFSLWPPPVWILALVCLSAGVTLICVRQIIPGWFFIAIFVLIALLMANIKTQGLRSIYEPLRRADYDEALARADRLLRWFPRISLFHDLRGSTLRYAGRLAEAEQAFRTSIEMGQVKPGLAQALHLENLAEVLLDLGRFDDATAVFEASIRIFPRNSGAGNGLAEVCLRRGRDSRRALLLVDNALQLKQSNLRTRNLDRHNLANMWANRAQALAMLGQKDEANSAIVTAGEVGDPEFIPGLAGTYWRCGVAFRLLDQEQSALEQFQKAIEMDPHGLYGHFAAAALQEQPAHH
jgi:tetratricopeptide (TPR) repeat protein